MPLLAPWGRVSWFLKWGVGSGRSMGQVEAWLRWSAHPLGGAVCSDHARSPAFALDTSEVAVGFWSFCIFLFIICPNCPCMKLFLVPCSFFVFCCWRRGLSRCKHCSKGSQVPACLKISFSSSRLTWETFVLSTRLLSNVRDLPTVRPTIPSTTPPLPPSFPPPLSSS